MTDRELLELAALAAKLPVRWVDGFGFALHPNGESIRVWWNPLEDDGDCARLEVAMHMMVDVGDLGVLATYLGENLNADHVALYKDHGGDKNKARRFASVSVAAEVGEWMKEQQ